MTTSHIDDALLLAYLDGNAPAETMAAIEASADLQARAQALANDNQIWSKALYRNNCPSSDELADAFSGDAVAVLLKQVNAHLTECPHCTREMTVLRRIMGPVTQPIPDSPRLGFIQWVANLIESTVAPQGSFALRGENDGPLMFSAGDAQIAIDVQEDSEHAGFRVIDGLVTGPTLAGANAALWQDGALIATVPVSELGNFEFGHLSEGTYELIIRNDGDLFHIEALTV